MDTLTLPQQKALEFITNHTERIGYAPTLREICKFMGYKAVGSAQDIVTYLRKKGFLIVPDKQAARCLILSDRAKEYCKVKHPESRQSGSFLSIPQLGSVPAGLPAEAIENFKGSVCIAPSMIPRWVRKPEKLFALQTKGLSMINAGIMDGDWLIVHQQEEAPSGSIVVAQLEGSATVKRLMQNEKKIWYLKPENPDFEEVYADRSIFTITGSVVALQRSYEDFS